MAMTAIQFEDFNFKLAVINKLMYEDETLGPRFDIHEFASAYTKREVDVDEDGYEVIPEAKAYFEALEIPPHLLKDIESLSQDGGDDIYMNICPIWSGEDETFTIQSAEDAKHLPALKRATLLYNEDNPEILAAFEARGVQAGWV